GEHVSALLRLIEALDTECRNLWQTEKPSGVNAAVAGENIARLVEQDGVGEAELLNARRDLADLLWRMYPGVAGDGMEGVDRQPLDHRLQHTRDAAFSARAGSWPILVARAVTKTCLQDGPCAEARA